MKLMIHKFASRMLPVFPARHFVEISPEPGLRKRLANFIADSRKQYVEKNKSLSSNDKKYRPSPIWYFFVMVSLFLLMQNFFGGSHVEIISYSQFKSLVQKNLINDLVIRETTIDGNLKAAAAKEIFTP